MRIHPGTRLGPYEITGALGAGGMGEVYRARDPRLGRDVAIKIVAEGAARDADRLRRFDQEARTIAALSHPNVLAIYDVGTEAVPFLVTELLDGDSLRAIVDRGPIPTARTIDLARQLVSGLVAAHGRGIVHRDLKPDNIFVTADGRLKILDFGIARRIGSDVAGGGESLTRTHTVRGRVLGTPGYMAPEQVRGFEADHRADIFACGAILFEMLASRRAFGGETPADTMSAILNDPPSSLEFPAGTPSSLARVVRRCLEKHVNDRFQSAEDLAFAIESGSDVPVPCLDEPRTPDLTTIAVLPFVNMSADVDTRYFGAGLADDLVDALTRVSGLRVASRTSSFRFHGGEADVREIGRQLGVGVILEGSVRRAGARLRVSAQLTNAADGYHIWSGRYDRALADVFDIQDEIVESIVSAVAPALASCGVTRAAASGHASSLLAPHARRDLVRPEPEERGVAEMPVRSPLDEPDLRDQPRLHPAHLAHLLGRDAAAPVGCLAVRQIDERAGGDVQRLQRREHFPPQVRSEPGADLAGKSQRLRLVVPDEQRVHARRPGPVPADDELLLPIELELHPRRVAIARHVFRSPSLRDHSLEAEAPHGLEDFPGGSGEVRRHQHAGSVDHFSQAAPACLERRARQVLIVAAEEIEGIEDDGVISMSGGVLKRLKRRPATRVDSDDLSVHDRPVRPQAQRGGRHGWIRAGQILVVPGSDLHPGAVLHQQCPVAVELDLVHPVAALGQPVDQAGGHRGDERQRSARANRTQRAPPCALA